MQADRIWPIFYILLFISHTTANHSDQNLIPALDYNPHHFYVNLLKNLILEKKGKFAILFRYFLGNGLKDKSVLILFAFSRQVLINGNDEIFLFAGDCYGSSEFVKFKFDIDPVRYLHDFGFNLAASLYIVDPERRWLFLLLAFLASFSFALSILFLVLFLNGFHHLQKIVWLLLPCLFGESFYQFLLNKFLPCYFLLAIVLGCQSLENREEEFDFERKFEHVFDLMVLFQGKDIVFHACLLQIIILCDLFTWQKCNKQL